MATQRTPLSPASPRSYNGGVTIRAVLFDVGDTLWPGLDETRREAITEAVGRLPALRALAPQRPRTEDLLAALARAFAAEHRRLLGGDCRQTPGEDVVRRALADLGLACPSDELVTSLLDCVLDDELRREPGPADEAVAAVLCRLAAGGLQLGAVSNTYLRGAGLRDALDRRGFLAHLSVVVASSEVGFQKPHQSLFREPLRRLGVDPADAVFVGDNLYCDIAGAKAAGLRTVQTVQFRRDQADGVVPDAVIEHLRELPALLAGW